ncbi:MAG: hypothetical protein GXO08_03615 [Aquificae bacterium]|nr:hypothetical protein [Aquificota bacterium]
MNLLIVWGLIILVLGIAALVAPYYFAVGSVVLLGSLLVAAGLFWLLFNLSARQRGAGAWLKPFILIVVGLVMLFFPEHTLVVLAALLLVYLLVDAFASLYLALELRPMLSSWFLMVLNALVDLVLAAVLLLYLPRPEDLARILGLLVGVSLVVDGLLALWFGWRLKRYYEKYKRLIEG